jgi:branched-chain amino acid transport system ATP-binding protein
LSHEDSARQAALVRDIKRDLDVTILMIEHVMEATMHVCDRVAVLASGTIIAEDIPEVIVHDQRVIDVYLGTEHEKRGVADA